MTIKATAKILLLCILVFALAGLWTVRGESEQQQCKGIWRDVPPQCVGG